MDLRRFDHIPKNMGHALQLRRKLCVFTRTSFFFAQVPKPSAFLHKSPAEARIHPQGIQHVSCPFLDPFPLETSRALVVILAYLEEEEEEGPDQLAGRSSRDHDTTLVPVFPDKENTSLHT